LKRTEDTFGAAEVIETRRRTALNDILESRPYQIVTISKDSTIADAVRR
jgi:hypothetical protein